MMRRFIVLSLALLATTCGDSPKTVVRTVEQMAQMLPPDGTPTGWAQDQNGSCCQGEANCVASPIVEDACIDGSMGPFVAHDPRPIAFAGQAYVNGNRRVSLWVFENGSADAAASLYSFFDTCTSACGNLYVKTWEPVTGAGQATKIASTGTMWWVIGYQGKHYFKVELTELTDTGSASATTDASKAAAIAYVQALAAYLTTIQ